MLGRIYESAFHTKGKFVLKVFDRHSMSSFRQEEEHMPPLTPDLDLTFQQLQFTEKVAALEKYLKREVYRRLEDIQGRDVPRQTACIELAYYYASKYTYRDVSSPILDIPDIFMEYIRGFPLSNIYEAGQLPARRDTWQGICEDAIRVINVIRGRDIINRDVNVRSSVVCHNPVSKTYENADQAGQNEEGPIGMIIERRLEQLRDGGFRYDESEKGK
ncbi:hypothetical protein K469DRAFT_724181 [Zopfia rhizophila CBS 207.26]|uniref:Protein kinase domain-containing protein n=1 Tax=Zopfia rhizophila CBS 207.26 TaxID=1314779 RepID=A0A6A6DAQ7_9PEZI|nr:hypothetical protein K469DRAFT_724181 [Zopfia rhizophila CBS 207.26]